MKAMFASLWNRRWCRCILWAAIVLGLAASNPFTRQFLIGPRFKGWPLCIWENRVRALVDPERRQANWFQKALAFIGGDQADKVNQFDDSAELLPLYLHLAEDRDPRVRRLMLLWLRRRREPDVVALHRRHLQDDDVDCRLFAACGLWHTSADREVKAVLLAIPDDCEAETRHHVVAALSDMAKGDADLFEPLAKWTEDADWRVRETAVYSMRHFGKRGAAVLRAAMLGKDDETRSSAIRVTLRLGKDAAELIPVLESIKNNPRDPMRHYAQEALTEIDAARFPPPVRTKKKATAP